MRWWTLYQLKSKDPKSRLQAVEALAADGKASAVEPLLAALRDPEADVRQAAAKSLAQFGDGRAVTPLIRLLNDPSAGVRQTVVESLRRLGDPRVVNALVPLLRDHSHKVRWRAATALDALGWRPGDDTQFAFRAAALDKLELAASVGPAALEALVAMLQDKSLPARHAVVEALSKIGDARVFKPLEAATRDEDNTVRTAAVEALSQVGDARAVDTLLRVVSDRDANVRAAAVEALGRAGDVRAVEPIARLIKDDSWDVRILSVEALGKLRDKRAVSALIAALKDGDHDVRQAAAEALGQIQDPGAIAQLILLLKDENSSVRQAAALALRRTDRNWEKSEAAQQVLPELEAALKDKEYWVRQAAADALAKISDVRRAEPSSTTFADAVHHKRNIAMDALTATLRDGDACVRQAAAEALGRMGDARAVDVLVAALPDPDEWVARAAAFSLEQLNWQPGSAYSARARQLILLRKWDETVALGAAAIEPLAEVLERRGSSQRLSAAKAVGIIGGAETVPVFVKALTDRYRPVRRVAVEALRRLGWEPDSPAQATQAAIELGDWSAVAAGGAVAVTPLFQSLEESSDDPDLVRGAVSALVQILQSQAELEEEQLEAILGLKELLPYQVGELSEQASTLSDPLAFDCLVMIQLAEQALAARKAAQNKRQPT